MVKFSPTALNFGYDFVVLVHFWNTLYNSIIFNFRSKDGDWLVGTTIGNNKKGVHLRYIV